MGSSILASVVIVNYNSQEDLDDSIPSVLDQSIDRDKYEVIVVDNNSSDESVEMIRREYPDVRLMTNDTNRWYAGGNNDGLEAAAGEYLVVLNPDVVVEFNWLEELIDPLRKSKNNVGMTTSKIVQYQARDKMNTSGTHLHFTGLGFSRGKNKHPTKYPCRETVPGVSGCSFAMSRAVYDEIGGFDELMEFYHEDVDISWRALLAGYQIVYTPESVVYHKYDRDLPSWRFYNYERNRLMIIIKYLKVRTVLCILPAILLTEVVMLSVSLRGLNYFLSKFRVWFWIWKHRKELGIKRRKAQKLRQRSDGELLSQFEITIPLDQFGVPVVVHTITNLLLAIVYWPCYQLATRQC